MKSFLPLFVVLSSMAQIVSAAMAPVSLRSNPQIAGSPPDYRVPTIELSDLQDPGTLQALLEESSGLISISVQNSPSAATISSIRNTALQSLCASTGLADTPSVSSSLLTDGTRRTTIATATIGNSPIPLEIPDSNRLEALRDVVAGLAKEVTQALDGTISQDAAVLLRTKSGRTYDTFTEIAKASHNLEHFHLYEKTVAACDNDEQAALPMHTDAGLFLVFVPGMDCDDTSNPSDLYIEVDGVEHRAVFEENSFGVMFGTGAEHWLLQHSFQAARHAVRMKCGARRAWYGMMHLVPQDTLLQDLPQRTFADLRHSMAHSKDRTYKDDDGANFASIGCGLVQPEASSRIEVRHRLQMVEDPSACNNVTNFFCWMSCLSIPEPPTELEGSSLYCLDPQTLDATRGNLSAAVSECTGRNGRPGAVHNDICVGQWGDSSQGLIPEAVDVKEYLLGGSDNSFEAKFCYGGTSMYMDGFHWLGDTCVIYLFPGWVLSTTGALVGACFGSILFGMALEGIIRTRRHVVSAIPMGTWKRLLMSATFYGLQLTMGYMIMLIVMTYSGPLFLSVILGLMGGHVVFNADQARSDHKLADSISTPQESANGSYGSVEDIDSKNDNRVPEGCTPCCQNTL